MPTSSTQFISSPYRSLPDLAPTARSELPTSRRQRCTPPAEQINGWQGFACERAIDPSAVTEERLWILSPLQRFLWERFHGVGPQQSVVAPVRDWAKLGQMAAVAGYGPLSPAAARDLYEFSATHLKAFESGLHWVASLCNCTLQQVKNRIKSCSPLEAEALLPFFGIGGPRQSSSAADVDLPQRVAISLARIRGALGESYYSLRYRLNSSKLSPRLRSVLSEMTKPPQNFTEEMIDSHLKAIAPFNEFHDQAALLDLVLNSARFLHYQGPRRDDLRIACEQFLHRIPRSLWCTRTEQSQASSVLVPDASAPQLSANDSVLRQIVRTVVGADRVQFLGELILGTLGKLYASGVTANPEKAEAIRAQFIASQYRLAVGISKEFTGRTPREDLVQEAIAPLIAEVDRFEPALGMRFATHAYWPMKKAMRRLVQREVKEVLGLPLKRQDQLERFERDCERAGCYVLNFSISNNELAERLNRDPEAQQRTPEQVRRLRSLLYLAESGDLPCQKNFLPGSKISLNAPLDPGDEDGGAPEREFTDEKASLPRDLDAALWLTESLRRAWEEKLYLQYFNQARVERDLAIFRTIQFGPKSLTAPEIAEQMGVSVQTARRAFHELQVHFKQLKLDLSSPESDLLAALQGKVKNPATLERNLRIYRLAALPGASSADIAKQYGVDDSNVRLICRRLRALADVPQLGAAQKAEAVIAGIRAKLAATARAHAAEEAARRLRVVERVAFSDGEKHDQIGATFGFSGSNLRQILAQAKEIAEQIGLRQSIM